MVMICDPSSPDYIIVNEDIHTPANQRRISLSPSTTPHSLEVNNLVVNKLYDITSKTENKIPNHCNSTCKCDVEIQPGTNGLGISIKIKDCYCNELIRVNNNNNNSNAHNNNQTTMVENPDYLDTPKMATSTLSLAPIETGVDNEMRIDSNDLLDFAVQIANGMVS